VRYLLDTNALSQLVREPSGSVAKHLVNHAEADLFTSIVVACELRYGARKRGSAALAQRIEQLLKSLEVAALEPGIDEGYARVRTELESRGTPIGANDLLIAAHALAEHATLVTDNTAEFQRVPGLVVENWSR
jgi:tRNA(fMet)-specific endonuclease VapC